MNNVAIIFNLLKQIENKTTFKDIAFHSLSIVIDDIFSELKEMVKLHLKANKVSILKNFFACFPCMFYKTFTSDRIIQGFINVGILYTKHKFWPDFHETLKTNRRSMTRSEMQIIKKKISQYFKIMLETGNIPEIVYYALGFPKDEVSGVVCYFNDVIERVWIQREKL